MRTPALAGVLTLGALVAAGGARRASQRARALRRLRTSPGESVVGDALRRLSTDGLPEAPAWLRGRLADAGISAAPERVWAAWVTGAVGALLAGLAAGGPAVAVVGAAAGSLGPALLLVAFRGRGAAHAEAAVPEVLDAVARALRSGASLGQAVAEAAAGPPAALAGDLGSVGAALARGERLGDAVEGWAARRPLPAVRLAVAALAVGAETGGASARAVESVATTIRQRTAVAAEARALATQARVSAGVIAVAPLAFAVVAAAADPRSTQFLLHTPQGAAVLAVGLVLDAAGGLWMARLTRVRVP